MERDHRYAEFEELARPLIKFLNDNFHANCYIHIENDHAKLMEGISAFHTEEFFRD